MSEKVTINMSAKFIDWWKTLAPHVQENQTTMLIAWWAWEKSRKVLKEVQIELANNGREPRL